MFTKVFKMKKKLKCKVWIIFLFYTNKPKIFLWDTTFIIQNKTNVLILYLFGKNDENILQLFAIWLYFEKEKQFGEH